MPTEGKDPTGAVVREAVNLRRYENGLARDVAKDFRKAADQLKVLMSKYDVTERRSDLRKLLAAANEVFDKLYRNVEQYTNRQLLDLAKLESDFARGILQTAVGAAVDIKGKRIGKALAKSILETDPIQGEIMKKWWSQQKASTATAFRQQIQLGMSEHESIPQLVRRVRGRTGLMETKRRQAEALTRTAVNEVATKAKLATFEANDDITQAYELVVTFDSRTSDICIALDGKTYRYDDPARRMPPFHFNAILPGERVLTGRGEIPIESVTVGDVVWTHRARWRRVYATMSRLIGKNRALRLELGTGRVIRITDEHPVLTLTRGWQRAGDLQRGDQVFQYVDQLPQPPCRFRATCVEQAVLLDAHNGPSQPNEALIPYGVGSFSARMATAVDFKGNHIVWEGDVDDVAIDGQLQGHVDPASLQDIEDCRFVDSGFASVGGSAASHGPISDRVIPAWVVGSEHSAAVTFGESFTGSGLFGPPMVGTRWHGTMSLGRSDGSVAFPNGDTVLSTPVVEAAWRQPKFTFDQSDTLAITDVLPVNQSGDIATPCKVHSPSNWFATPIISIVDVEHKGYVWNLGVERDETYLVGDVVVHNCRTTIAPVLDWSAAGLEPPEEGTKWSRDTETGKAKYIKSSTRYSEWLKDQPVAVQNEILGKGRAQLWRDGKIRLDQLVRRDLSTVTYEDFRKRLGLDE